MALGNLSIGAVTDRFAPQQQSFEAVTQSPESRHSITLRIVRLQLGGLQTSGWEFAPCLPTADFRF